MDIKIAILPGGWVFVGDFSTDGEMVTLKNSYNIRVWGTRSGLGQIQLNGPTKDTVLDPSGDVRFHILTAILMDCVPEKWKKYFEGSEGNGGSNA